MQFNIHSFIQIINFHGLFRNALRCWKTGACQILVPLRYSHQLFSMIVEVCTDLCIIAGRWPAYHVLLITCFLSTVSCLLLSLGVECDEAFDLCHDTPCQNNATCISSPTHYECQCIEGYHGNHCELELNPCSPDPCLNDAKCRVAFGEAGGYECNCTAGFSGLNCSQNINECHSNPCRNGATCSDEVNGYQCLCTTGNS